MKSPYVHVIDTSDDHLVRKVGPFGDSVRPLAINGRNSMVVVNVNQYIWNDIVYYDNSGHVSSVTHLWLVVQSDGNLVLYQNIQGSQGTGTVAWHASTYGNDGAYATMRQTDGTMVIYNKDNRVLLTETRAGLR